MSEQKKPSSNEKATNSKSPQKPEEAPIKAIVTPEDRKIGRFSETGINVPEEKE
jgi:hypothetical protein